MRRSTFWSFTAVLLPLLLAPAEAVSSYSSSSGGSTASLYADFLHCLEHRTQSSTSSELSGTLYSRSNSSYAAALQSYVRNRRFNTSSAPKPQLILAPSQQLHVSAAVLCSRDLGLHLRTRSGGHDFEGVSYVSQSDPSAPFIVLDTFNFRSIEVDVAGDSAWVGSGATLGELYYRIWERSRAHGFPAGICPTVGVGGHFSGGGYGNMLRKFGLSVDNIIDAKIVDVEGRVLDRASMGEDLFWAIRGGGGASFGVILAYKIKLVPVPETVTVFRVEKTLEENATELVYRWQYVAPATDNGLFMRLLLQPVTSRTRKGEKTIKASVLALFLGNADQLVLILGRELPELSLRKEDCKEISWIDSVIWWGFKNRTAPEALLDRTPESVSFLKRKSDYVQVPIPRDGLESLWKKMVELGNVGLVFNPYGGVMGEVASSETPFPHRAGNLYKIQYSISWSEEGPEAENNCLTQIRSLYSFMTPFVSKDPRRAYLNYRDLDIGIAQNSRNIYSAGSVHGVKYFAGNFERLVAVKTAVDQQNFFRNEQSIPPLPSKPSK